MKYKIFVLTTVFGLTCCYAQAQSASGTAQDDSQKPRFNKMRYDSKARKTERKYGKERFNRLERDRKEAYKSQREKKEDVDSGRFHKMRLDRQPEEKEERPWGKKKFKKLKRDRIGHREKRLKERKDHYRERIENMKERNRANPEKVKKHRLRRLNEKEAEYNAALERLRQMDEEWAEKKKTGKRVESYETMRNKRAEAMKEHQKDGVERIKNAHRRLNEKGKKEGYRLEAKKPPKTEKREEEKEEVEDAQQKLFKAREEDKHDQLRSKGFFGIDTLEDQPADDQD